MSSDSDSDSASSATSGGKSDMVTEDVKPERKNFIRDLAMLVVVLVVYAVFGTICTAIGLASQIAGVIVAIALGSIIMLAFFVCIMGRLSTGDNALALAAVGAGILALVVTIGPFGAGYLSWTVAAEDGMLENEATLADLAANPAPKETWMWHFEKDTAFLDVDGAHCGLISSACEQETLKNTKMVFCPGYCLSPIRDADGAASPAVLGFCAFLAGKASDSVEEVASPEVQAEMLAEATAEERCVRENDDDAYFRGAWHEVSGENGMIENMALAYTGEKSSLYLEQDDAYLFSYGTARAVAAEVIRHVTNGTEAVVGKWAEGNYEASKKLFDNHGEYEEDGVLLVVFATRYDLMANGRDIFTTGCIVGGLIAIVLFAGVVAASFVSGKHPTPGRNPVAGAFVFC